MNSMEDQTQMLSSRGYVTTPITEGLDYVEEIKRLKKEKNAVLLAHYYQEDAIQDLADFLGDSLYLAQAAAEVDADLIVLAGVHFMADSQNHQSDKKSITPRLEGRMFTSGLMPTPRFCCFQSPKPRCSRGDLYQLFSRD